MNPVIYLLQLPRLLDQMSELRRYRHYNRYCVWFFMRWSGRGGSLRHPREMGAAEVMQFLSMLVNERRVSVSTQNQALSALLFLYRDVLGGDLPRLTELQRPSRPPRIPSVLTQGEVAALLGAMEDVTGLPARLLYSTGMRLMEG